MVREKDKEPSQDTTPLSNEKHRRIPDIEPGPILNDDGLRRRLELGECSFEGMYGWLIENLMRLHLQDFIDVTYEHARRI